MKILYVFLMCFSLMFAISCSEDQKNQFKIDTAQNLATALSYAAIKVGHCKQDQKVKDKMLLITKKWFGLKHLDEKGLLGMVCSSAVEQLVPMIFGQAIKFDPEWECDFADFNAAVISIGQTACSYIPI